VNRSTAGRAVLYDGGVSGLSSASEAEFFAGLRFSEDFFMGRSSVHAALRALVQRLDADEIPYAIIGAMALNEFGYRRTTEDVDVLMTAEGLQAFKEKHLGRGYVERLPGGRGLRDTVHGVEIDVVITGDYPGDGEPKPVRFPDPSEVAERGASVSLLPLERLIELKLASGMSAPHRLRDLADVLELIRILDLDRAVGEQLDPSVRGKFDELWQAARQST
jgi:hypothetical protein